MRILMALPAGSRNLKVATGGPPIRGTGILPVKRCGETPRPLPNRMRRAARPRSSLPYSRRPTITAAPADLGPTFGSTVTSTCSSLNTIR